MGSGKNFVKKSSNWKRQTAKAVIGFALGTGIGWGFFSSQTNPATAWAANTKTNVQENQKAYISGAEAQMIAATHAKVTVIDISDPSWIQTNLTENMVIVKKCKLDWEDGVMVYEIEFFSNNYEYDYKIHAVTGTILRQEKERENHTLAIQALKNRVSADTETVKETTAATNTDNRNTYIGTEKAKTIAYTHAGVTKENSYPGWCELEREDGIPIYELEFQSMDGYDYEYEIHAVTGEILSSKKEQSMHYAAIQANRNGQTGDTIVYIHQSEAESTAVSHAGVTQYQIISSKLDREDGMIVYEVKFYADNYEYDYKINAMTGEVTGYKKELSDSRPPINQAANTGNSTNNATNNTNTPPNGGAAAAVNGFISETDARNVALQHAKAATNRDITKYEVELKNKKGVYLYEIEFKMSGFEYEYKINATTGEILEYEREWDD